LFGNLILITQLNGKRKKTILKPGDTYTTQKKEIHEFTTNSKNGCIVEEISTRSIKSDSYYLDKKINLRTSRKSYISFY
jgi:hypothetical protein